MAAIAEFLLILAFKIALFLTAIITLMFTSLGDMLLDLILTVVLTLIRVAVSMVADIDLPTISATWSILPAEMIGFFHRAGFPQCFQLVTSALVTRLTLQLIPFTRLGS